MINRIVNFRSQVFISLIIVIVMMLSLSGCNKSASTVSVSQTDLDSLQEYKYLTGKLYAVMSFAFSGTTMDWPTELTISSVPIQWMGQVFNGQSEESGPGEELTDEIHGGISADGKWLLNFYFSRSIINLSKNTAIFYRVTLKNIPLFTLAGSTAFKSGTFEKEGDIQKYIEQVEYTAGLWDGSKIIPTTTYISTDWNNTGRGQKPILKLTFEQTPSELLGSGQETSGGSGMMGN